MEDPDFEPKPVAWLVRVSDMHFEDLRIVRNTPKPREHDLPPQFSMSVAPQVIGPPRGQREDTHALWAVLRSHRAARNKL
jgi:hypothetical protein